MPDPMDAVPSPSHRSPVDLVVPERFDPLSMRGDIAEAEHLSRYGWASTFADRRRVLDAGCGLGYGAAMLARAGARRVVGIDISESTLAAARSRVADAAVDLRAGDLQDLDLADDGFDLVVCFEVIEHVEDRAALVRELQRVLAPGGLLFVSSPNRDVYVPGNPHHVFEYRPEELEAELTARFAHVSLRRQHGWLASAILDDESLASRDGSRLSDLTVDKLDGVLPGRETYTLAVASDAPLPALPQWTTLAGTVEVRRWLELYDLQQDVLRRQHDHFEELSRDLADQEALRRRAEDAEREAAQVPRLTLQRDAAVTRADRALADQAGARARLEALSVENARLTHALSAPQAASRTIAVPRRFERLRALGRRLR